MEDCDIIEKLNEIEAKNEIKSATIYIDELIIRINN